MSYRYDYGDGNVDGDASAPVQWQPGGVDRPWLRAAAPPWHLWGNTQPLIVEPNAFTNPNVHDQATTLLRVAYKRPETWHFLFSARILNAPAAGGAEQGTISVWFELFTGIGRSAIRLPFWVVLPSWSWSGSAAPTTLAYASSAGTGVESISITTDPGGAMISSTRVPVMTDQIVGQDMTVIAHPTFTTNIAGATAAQVEVSGQFAPASHVRPDWYRNDGPAETQFPGSEIEGQ